MGEAADDAWDSAFNRMMEMDMLMKAIREQCGHPEKACRLVRNDSDDEDDWLPFKCAVCGERFDYP